MAWKFDNDIPIYIQIMDEIKLRIAQGKLNEGDKVPSVRELALKAGVNPNTMQKALAELEREGVLYSNRTAGRFVAPKGDGDRNMRDTIAEKYILVCVDGLRGLGYTDEQILLCMENKLKERN